MFHQLSRGFLKQLTFETNGTRTFQNATVMCADGLIRLAYTHTHMSARRLPAQNASLQGLHNFYRPSSLSELDHFLASSDSRRCLKMSHFPKYGGVLWRQNLWLSSLLFKWTTSSSRYKLDFACLSPNIDSIAVNKEEANRKQWCELCFIGSWPWSMEVLYTWSLRS